jgi:hypothetical protein
MKIVFGKITHRAFLKIEILAVMKIVFGKITHRVSINVLKPLTPSLAQSVTYNLIAPPNLFASYLSPNISLEKIS